MKQINIHNRCSDFNSYRASRVKSLFNAESGCNFDLTAELPADDLNWRIGLIIGPSGSGKVLSGVNSGVALISLIYQTTGRRMRRLLMLLPRMGTSILLPEHWRLSVWEMFQHGCVRSMF